MKYKIMKGETLYTLTFDTLEEAIQQLFGYDKKPENRYIIVEENGKEIYTMFVESEEKTDVTQLIEKALKWDKMNEKKGEAARKVMSSMTSEQRRQRAKKAVMAREAKKNKV